MDPWGRPALDGDINMETVNGLTLDQVQLCQECGRECPLDSVDVVVRSGSFIEATCRECKDKVVNFPELARGIRALLGEEVSVNIEHTGGGTGTIFISADSSGLNTFAVGPASLSTGLALIEELCWGIDGEEPVGYAKFYSPFDSPNSLAVAIVTDYLKVSPRGWVVTFSQEVHDAK